MTFYPSIIRGSACTFVMTIVTLAYKVFFPTDSWMTLCLCGAVCTIMSSLINFTIIFNNSERTKVLNIITTQFKKYLHK